MTYRTIVSNIQLSWFVLLKSGEHQQVLQQLVTCAVQHAVTGDAHEKTGCVLHWRQQPELAAVVQQVDMRRSSVHSRPIFISPILVDGMQYSFLIQQIHRWS